MHVSVIDLIRSDSTELVNIRENIAFILQVLQPGLAFPDNLQRKSLHKFVLPCNHNQEFSHHTPTHPHGMFPLTGTHQIGTTYGHREDSPMEDTYQFLLTSPTEDTFIPIHLSQMFHLHHSSQTKGTYFQDYSIQMWGFIQRYHSSPIQDNPNFQTGGR